MFWVEFLCVSVPYHFDRFPSLGMAFNSQYCVVVDNDDFKDGAKIQLPLGATINSRMIRPSFHGGSVRVTNPC